MPAAPAPIAARRRPRGAMNWSPLRWRP